MGCVDLLSHEDVAVCGIQEVPSDQGSEDVCCESTIRYCGCWSVEYQGHSEDDEEIVQVLSDLIFDTLSKDCHGNADKQTTEDDEET